MTENEHETWRAIFTGSEVSIDVSAVITATRGIRTDVVPPVEQIFDKAADGSVLVVRKVRGEDLYDVVVWVPDSSG